MGEATRLTVKKVKPHNNSWWIFFQRRQLGLQEVMNKIKLKVQKGYVWEKGFLVSGSLMGQIIWVSFSGIPSHVAPAL